MKHLSDYHKQHIREGRRRSKILKEKGYFWSNSELTKLREVYPIYKTIDDLLSQFPNRSINGIKFVAQNVLHLKRKVRAKPRFSKETIEFQRKRFIKMNENRAKSGVFKGKGNPFYGQKHTKESMKKRLKSLKANPNVKTRKGYKQPSCAGKLNPAKRPEVRAKISRNGRIAQKKYLAEHPEKALNYRLRRDYMTKLESKMQRFLEGFGLVSEKDFKHNQYVKTVSGFKFPDFLIKNRLVVECDGAYWHKHKKKQDAQRDTELVQSGFTVIHFTEDEILNQEKEVKEVLDVLLNDI